MSDTEQPIRAGGFRSTYASGYGQIDPRRASSTSTSAPPIPREYLDLDTADHGPSMGETLMQSTGLAYLGGVTAGGATGLVLGARGVCCTPLSTAATTTGTTTTTNDL
jgi:hypothetical protein